jgi:predicted  nucleic acid-binding Zn-ribbon protein
LRKNLKLLGELQEIDLKVDSLQGEKDGLLAEVDGLEQQVAGVQSEITAKNGELAAFEEEKQRLEESLVVETDNIARSEARLKEIKTQKEYQAVSKEVSTAKKLKAELEEQILQKIGQIEELKGDITGREENLRALEENVDGQKAEVQKKIEQLEAAIAADSTAREAAVKGLPASVMRRYGLLREQRRGIAVVEAKDGYCLGCNMQLPPQLYNTLFRGDELIACPHCQRVLLLRQEEKE